MHTIKIKRTPAKNNHLNKIKNTHNGFAYVLVSL